MVHRKKNSLAESRGSSRFLSFKKKLFLISGTFKFFLFTGAIFERIFPPGGKSWDLTDSCFPYTFGPIFIPPIHFRSNSSFFLNQFLANSGITVLHKKCCNFYICVRFEILKISLWNGFYIAVFA